MRKQVLAIVLLLALSLSGCASLLTQSYVAVTPHDKQPAAEVDSSAIRVEDYPQLVSAILYLVSQGEEEGILRLHNYLQDVRADLAAACDEVSHEDPLGAYAVDGINFSFKRIVTYYEATVAISYRRTPEQIAAVVPVTGSGAIRAVLGDTLAAFAPEVALRVNYFGEDAEYIESLVRRAYYDAPAYAQGLPEAEVRLYPETGTQRVVEVVLTYPERSEDLLEKSAETQDAAKALVYPLVKQERETRELLSALYKVLLRPEGDSAATPTSHAALVAGGANSEGMALGFKLLCDLAAVPCQVVEGKDEVGEPRFWTIVKLEGEYRHLDPYGADGLPLTDADLLERGFTWDQNVVPACGMQEKLEISKNIGEIP